VQDDSGSGGAVSEVSASAVPLIDFSFEEEEEVICLLIFLLKLEERGCYDKISAHVPAEINQE